MNAPEFDSKIKISISLLVTFISAAFVLGGMITKINDLNNMILQEVGGLRSDWERELKTQHELNKKLDTEVEALKERLWTN